MSGGELLTRIGLMRHARTVWNREKRMQGQYDTPLTPRGKRQIRQWGQKLGRYRWDRIVASDIGRSRRTAERLSAFLKVPLCIEPGLREQDWGEWTGKTLRQIRREAPEFLAAREKAGWGFCPPGGENRYSVWRRSRLVLLQSAKRWPGATLLLVTHESVIKSIVYRCCKRRFVPTEPALLRPYHLHWLQCDTGHGLQLQEINALALDEKSTAPPWRMNAAAFVFLDLLLQALLKSGRIHLLHLMKDLAT